MVCLGNKQRSFCHLLDCTQTLHSDSFVENEGCSNLCQLLMFMGGWVDMDYICHLYIHIRLYTRFPNLVASSHIQGRHQSWYFDSSSTMGVCIIYKLMIKIKILGLDSFLPVIQIILKKKITVLFLAVPRLARSQIANQGLNLGPWQWKRWALTARNSHCHHCLLGRASLATQTVKNLPAMWETQVWSLCWKDPLENELATHSIILAWRIPWTEELSKTSNQCFSVERKES